jgi:hypothetical protein
VPDPEDPDPHPERSSQPTGEGERTTIELATVELLGALAYGQLRSFEVTARAVRHAPDSRRADALAQFAVREHAGYALLRDHLASLTDLPEAVMDRQKPHFDAYFDRVPVDDGWFAACTFFAFGLPIAADFGRDLAPALDNETALVVVGALSDRGPFERFAIDELRPQLEDEEARDRSRHLVADVLGRALTGFQGVMSDTDALKVLLDAAREPGETGEARVKRLAIEVMSGHRRRVVELGLEDLEDVR